MSETEIIIQVSNLFDRAKAEALELLGRAGRSPQPKPRGQRMLKAKEVAERLNVSVDKVYDMRRDGRLPAVDLGEGSKDRWRWPESRVDAYTGE